jgi:hypothetical protein
MLQHFFKLMFRMTGRKAVHPADRRCTLPTAEVSVDLVPIVPEPLMPGPKPAANLIHGRESRAMQQPLNDPTSKPGSQDSEQSDGKVVQFTARRRMEPERDPKAPMPDDDPGPSAA